MDVFIYVIAARDEGPCKIGFSNSPEERLKQLQTGHPEQLVLRHTVELEAKQGKLLERMIHKTLKHQRSVGEWFNLSVDAAIGEVDFAVIRYEHANLRDYL
jgi:Meiotically up-regulated gene 113